MTSRNGQNTVVQRHKKPWHHLAIGQKKENGLNSADSFFAFLVSSARQQRPDGQQALGRPLGRFPQAVDISCRIHGLGKRVTRFAAQLLVGHFSEAALRHSHGRAIGIGGLRARQAEIKGRARQLCA